MYKKTRIMPMDKHKKWMRRHNKLVPEAIETDIGIAMESHANSELTAMAESYAFPKQQNIPLISARFFQRFFLKTFNTATTTSELRKCLQSLLQRISEANSTAEHREQFEDCVRRLGYHSCIARIGFAHQNKINDGQIDIESMNEIFTECQSAGLVDHETYEFMLNGLINDYHQCTGSLDSETKQKKYDAVNRMFDEFEVFLNQSDPYRPRAVISETAYTQGFIAMQNKKYGAIYSAYLSFLCSREIEEDLIRAVDVFYGMMEHRYIIPDADTRLLVMEHIGNRSSDSAEIARLFRIWASYTVNSPPLTYYNRYLLMVAQFGDIDEAIKVLRLLVFKRYWNYFSIPDAPMPNLETFEIVFKSLKHAILNQTLTQDVGARKAEFVLKQMKELKIGTPHSVYVLLYESLGVAWWESLPWHLRLLNRP